MRVISGTFPHVGTPQRVRRVLLGLLVLGACTAVAGGTQAGRSRGTSGATLGGISIEPRSLHLTDRTYKEGDIVSGRFSIVNPLDRPVMINAINTSCSCMAVLPDAAAEIPFGIAPHSRAEFWVKGGVRAGKELQQSYAISVEAACDGRPLPDSTASLTFR